MPLAQFLLTHREQILSEWVAFARTCLPPAGDTASDGAKAPTLDALRDHASEMLDVIAADLGTSQTRLEQADKAEGKSDATLESAAADTAAQAHGADRADSGFTMEQMVAEYRALRASVIRLWIDVAGTLDAADLVDLIRFNEAIDQALAESTSRFSQELDRSREIFIGMLGHDLRNPLGAIIGWAHIMLTSQELPATLTRSASLIVTSGRRMNALVGDLLDFTRSRLGSGIPIVRAGIDLNDVCRQAVEEIAALHPDRVINLDARGRLQGEWDGARVSQALSNIISNAVEHGSDDTPINVSLREDSSEVRIAVQNCGPVIPPNQLAKIFALMHRLPADQPGGRSSNLGLGLYIAERIVSAHGGRIDVDSSKQRGTVFTLHLPRQAPAHPEPA